MTDPYTPLSHRFRFRAWDKNGKWMSYGEREDFDDMIAWRFAHWEPETDGREGLPDVVLMQCTGEKDRNKRDIYEGDIVSISVHGSANFVTTIEYYKNGFYLGDGLHSNWDAENVMVLGNIYDDPHLRPSSL